MNSQLLGRALGTAGPEALQRAELTRRLHAIQAAPRVLFDGRNGQYAAASERAIESGDDAGIPIRAHQAGVNCIAIDRFEGR